MEYMCTVCYYYYLFIFVTIVYLILTLYQFIYGEMYMFSHALCFSLSASGIIRVALPNMDREVKEMYQVVIQAKDMGGQLGGLAGTTTINITLRDVNDNPPRFSKSMFKSRCAGIIIERTEAYSILSAFLYQQQFIPGVYLNVKLIWFRICFALWKP